jgi:hypothetical protein
MPSHTIQRLVGAIQQSLENPKSTSSDSGIGTETERPVSRSHSMRVSLFFDASKIA